MYAKPFKWLDGVGHGGLFFDSAAKFVTQVWFGIFCSMLWWSSLGSAALSVFPWTVLTPLLAFQSKNSSTNWLSSLAVERYRAVLPSSLLLIFFSWQFWAFVFALLVVNELRISKCSLETVSSSAVWPMLVITSTVVPDSSSMVTEIASECASHWTLHLSCE